jgi:hypothetical protein
MRLKDRHKAYYLYSNATKDVQWKARKKHFNFIECLKRKRVIRGISYGPKSNT